VLLPAPALLLWLALQPQLAGRPLLLLLLRAAA
jgi:hypothetical protein